MKLLSIDIGIRNLSYCLFDFSSLENCCVQKWDNINLGEKHVSLCVAKVDAGVVCGKPGKFVKYSENIGSECYCLKHAKKMDYFLPISELKDTTLNKKKVGELMNLLKKYNIQPNSELNQPKLKRQEMLALLREFRDEKCFDLVEKTNSGKVNLVTIGENLMYKFDDIFSSEVVIDKVIIENQIGPLANKMKTIQGMISQYFIMRKPGIQIDFVNAGNKLKEIGKNQSDKLEEQEDFNKNKKDKVVLTYKDRKKKSIEICKQYVTTDHRFISWESFFVKHDKKDDLADCFLQGMWYRETK